MSVTSAGLDADCGLRTAVDIPNTKVTLLASGDGVAMCVTRRPELAAGQKIG